MVVAYVAWRILVRVRMVYLACIVRKSVYKNFCIMQKWAFKPKYDSGPKMRKFQSRRCNKTRGRRKRRSDRISWLGVMIELFVYA